MEGWGITTIEANACGTPVIASNVSGLKDSIARPHTGFLFKYGNEKKLANYLNHLIEDKRSRKMMSNYAHIWARKYDWNTSSLRFFAILDYEYYLTSKRKNFILNKLEAVVDQK
jgi:glycosyltransferase involved in cell wall biosynthesis